MKAKITAQLVNQLRADSSSYEVNDTELKGFQLRVLPTGTKTYLCAYRLRGTGRRNRVSIGRSTVLTPVQARDEAKKILGDVARGIDPNAARRSQRTEAKSPTLQEFIEQHYGPWANTHLGSAKQTLKRLLVAFRDMLQQPVDSITAWQVDKWKAKCLKRGLKAATVNRDLASLRAALSKATEWRLVPEHPLRGVKQVKMTEDHRVRFLSESEEIRLRETIDRRDTKARQARLSHSAWRVARGHLPTQALGDEEFSDHMPVMILLSINTGCRRGELFKLRHGDVDVDVGQLKIRAASAKSGKSRFIPLNVEAADVLRRWMRQHPGESESLVFPGLGGAQLTNVDSAWRSIVKAAALDNFRWHDLRHHFASRLVMAGVDLNTVRELLGHADLKMTLRYAHLAPEHKARAVAKLMRAA